MQEMNNWQYYRMLANKNILRVFNAIGVKYSERYSYICAPCPIHGGDRNDAFSWHIEYGMYQCFSRGCHEKYGKDVYGLLSGALNCDKAAAYDFLKKLFKNDKLTDEDIKGKESYDVVKKPAEPTYYDESVLSQLGYHDYLEKRGYPKELIKAYQIGYVGYGYKGMSNRIIVPVRDIDGNLVGFTGRTVDEKWKEKEIPKWYDSKNFKKSDFLFNLHNAKKYIESNSTVILVEGPFDVLRLEQAGIHNSVAVFGRKLHNAQLAHLLRLPITKVVIIMDSDNAGKTGAKSTAKLVESYFTTQNIELPFKDAGETPIEDLRRILNEFAN